MIVLHEVAAGILHLGNWRAIHEQPAVVEKLAAVSFLPEMHPIWQLVVTRARSKHYCSALRTIAHFLDNTNTWQTVRALSHPILV